MRTLLEKLAGRSDSRGLDTMTEPLNVGDLISFAPRGADIAAEGVRPALSHALVSEPIRKAQGSDISHTAIYMGRDPRGEPIITHLYEQGDQSGLTTEPLARYAGTRNLTGHIVPFEPDLREGVEEMIERLQREGNTQYLKRNLVAAAGPTLGSRIRQVAGPIGSPFARLFEAVGAATARKNCPPGTGICSVLPAQIWGAQVGIPEAVRVLSGGKATPQNFEYTLTPKMIAESPHLQSTTTYTPANSVGVGVVPAFAALGRRAAGR